MTEDRDLDAEIRATLQGMAGRPAPERLHARVASIPTDQRRSAVMRQSPVSALRLGFGFAGVLIAVAVIGGALVLRGGGGGVGAQSPTIPASAAVSTPAPTTATSTTPSDTPETQSPSPSPASAGAIPSDLEPLSVTFVSADVGWVLGRSATGDGGACPASGCLVIVRTADAGRTWTRIPAPPTMIGNPVPTQAGSDVSGLRFADALDGWAFGPGLWATHDGGQTWREIQVPGPAGAVLALEASAGSVHAAFDGGTGYRLASAAVASDSWTVAPVTVPYGAGPVPRLQLVLSGQAGWVIVNDRVVTSGARLVGGVWQAWQPPCLTVEGPAVLAASTAQDVVAVCDVGQWSTPQGEHLYRSANGGQTFASVGKLPVKGVAAVAAPDASTIVTAGAGSTGADVATSHDGGTTWRVVDQIGQVGVAYLGFTTRTQGVLITAGDTVGQGQLLMTRDGGDSWTAVGF